MEPTKSAAGRGGAVKTLVVVAVRIVAAVSVEAGIIPVAPVPVTVVPVAVSAAVVPVHAAIVPVSIPHPVGVAVPIPNDEDVFDAQTSIPFAALVSNHVVVPARLHPVGLRLDRVCRFPSALGNAVICPQKGARAEPHNGHQDYFPLYASHKPSHGFPYIISKIHS